MFRDRTYFDQGINQYVPAMQFSHAVLAHHPKPFAIGRPAAAGVVLSAAVPANAAVGTIVPVGLALDAKYGRTVDITPSADPGAAGGAVYVRGTDYLGQPMLERYVGASGSTAKIYGRKAFKRVKDIYTVVASTNAVTWAVATGNFLGLPYKGDIVWAKEAGSMVALNNRPFLATINRSAADAVAGGSYVVSPAPPGYVKTLIGQPLGSGGATNPTVTAEINNVAITGLSIVVDTDTQTRVTDTPATPGYNANNRILPGSVVELVATAAAGAGPDVLYLEIQPTQFIPPDLTDPATDVSGDPRGTYEALGALNGVNELVVGMIGDTDVNTNNNGGLHGIRHYYV